MKPGANPTKRDYREVLGWAGAPASSNFLADASLIPDVRSSQGQEAPSGNPIPSPGSCGLFLVGCQPVLVILDLVTVACNSYRRADERETLAEEG